MKQNQLGTSEIYVSEISYGCMSLGTDYATASSLLHQALDLGITTFDTADLYDRGENERILGKAFRGLRQDIILASKVGNQWRADGSGWDWNPGKAYLKTAVMESLQRLQTDYLDLCQLHGGTIDDPIDEVIEAFEELKQAGHIREYAISSIRPNVIREYVLRSNIVSVMTQYSLLDRRPEEATLNFLNNKQVSVVARGVVAKGLLAGKAAKSTLGYSTEEVGQFQRGLLSISDGHRTMAQLAIRYALDHPAVATIAAGASSLEQLRENVATIHTPALSPEEKQLLQSWLPARYYEQHR